MTTPGNPPEPTPGPVVIKRRPLPLSSRPTGLDEEAAFLAPQEQGSAAPFQVQSPPDPSTISPPEGSDTAVESTAEPADATHQPLDPDQDPHAQALADRFAKARERRHEDGTEPVVFPTNPYGSVPGIALEDPPVEPAQPLTADTAVPEIEGAAGAAPDAIDSLRTDPQEGAHGAHPLPATDTGTRGGVASPTSHPFARGLSEAALHLRTAQGNLAALADQIERGEFGANGAGDAGRIWRAISTSPQSDRDDIWGEIMASSTGLWAAGHMDQSITLVERAVHDFGVPELWQDRVTAALSDAHDFRATMAAESAFEAGNNEEALELAGVISNQEEAEHYRQGLKQRAERRTRQRRIIFMSAGAAISGLLVASVIAITTMDRLSPPLAVPDFAAMGDALETVSTELRDQRTARDEALAGGQVPVSPLDQSLASDPLAALAAPAPAAVAPVPITPAPQQPDVVLPQPEPAPDGDTTVETFTVPITPLPAPSEAAPTAAPTPTPAPAPTPPQSAPNGPVLDLESSGGEAASGSFAPVQTPGAPTTAAASDGVSAPAAQPTPTAQEADMVESCILGYAVLARAEGLANGPAMLERVAGLSGTLEAACVPLQIPPAEIARGMAALDPAMVVDMAQNILSGAQ